MTMSERDIWNNRLPGRLGALSALSLCEQAAKQEEKTMAQHTPGPWQAGQLGWIHAGDKWKLARVFSANPEMGFPDAPDEATTRANARLLAAAPALLEALIEAVSSLAYASNVLQAPANSVFEDSIRDARAAIAKATE